MAIPVLCFWLVVMAVVTDISRSRPSFQFDEHIRRLIESDDVHGYDVATVLAMDASNEEIGQTRRDLAQHASDPSPDERHFTLLLTSGERMRMSVHRRPIDTSGIRFSEVTEEGETEQLYPEIGNCFFTGTVEEQKGVVSISLCNGEPTGSMTTETRDYEIHPLPGGLGNNGSADDVVRVLVTWQDTERKSMASGFELAQQYLVDDLEFPGEKFSMSNDSGSNQVVKRSTRCRKVTIEIADFVDKYYIASLKKKFGINSNQKIIQRIYMKWNSAAHILSDVKKIGWDITLRLVEVGLWRTNPSWYRTSASDKIGERMTMACHGTHKGKYDQVTLHTAQTSDVKRVGLARIGGVCRPKMRCSASRSLASHHRTELHEMGHSLGLNHDGKMSVCKTDSDQKNGFMGGNQYHFRNCYRRILDKTFMNPKKRCVFRKDNPNRGVEFP